jgi:hypothetical protein
MKMRKFICSLMMVSALSLAAPKQEAQASFLIVAGLEQHVWNHKHKFDDYIVPLFGLSLMAYSFSAIFTGMYSPSSIVAGIIMLDEKIENNQSNIEASLQHRYPYVDDASVIRNLAGMIVEQYPHSKDANGNAKVFLNASDVKNAIQSLDLNETQSQDLVQSLSS